MRLDCAALRDELTCSGVRRLAIDGPGGAGKSTLAAQLTAGWADAVVVAVDDFRRPASVAIDEPAGHGAGFDLDRLASQVLTPHAAGLPSRYQRYDWDCDSLAEWHDLPAAAVVLVEGVYSMSASPKDHFDFAIWVDAPHRLRLKRGLERDGESSRETWVEQWMPAERRYRDDKRPDARADLVLEGGERGFRVLTRRAR